ncbi:MAG: DUF1570 domain-containing protein [Candidatus Brocadiae bacterium]|nr:DUF1570 domain-containing protein [Candidatus Brocadiia bacterium]
MRPLLALLLLALPAAAGPIFEDRRAGVAFAPPDRWTEIPTPPVPEGDEAGDGLAVLARFEADAPGRDGTIGRFEVVLFESDSAVRARDALIAHARASWRGFGAAEPEEIAGGAGFRAEIEGGQAVGAVVSNGRRHAGLLLVGGERLETTPLVSAAGTLAWSDPDASAPLRVQPGWKARETRNYRIRYSGDDDFAAEVGRHLESISAELRRVLPLTPHDGARRSLDVRIFRNEKEFEAYASINGVRGAEAYFSPAQNELVAHMDESSPDRTFHVLYHEATHQYLRDALGKGVTIPIWLDEGLGEVFYPGTFARGGEFILPMNTDRREDARSVFRAGRAPDMDTLMGMNRGEFYTMKGAYSLGWSLAHFLLNDPRYRGWVMTYLETLRDTKDAARALEKAFGNSTPEQVERDWRRWVEEE